MSEPALLLVDDRRDNLLALSAVLEPLGHPILHAGSGEEALRHLLHEDVAVIVLDVQMPGMDGFETAERIKDRERTRDIPILFLTAISREDRHRLRGYQTGAVDYVFKPVDPDVLRAKVRVFFDLHVGSRLLAAQKDALARQAEELARSHADLEQFATIASHDLQEPLRVVSGFLELLGQRLGDRLDDEERDWMTRARSAADGMADLLAGLLLYARAGAPGREPTSVDLDAALDEACAGMHDAPAVRAERPLGAVLARRDEVARVFTGLLRHAGRAHRPGAAADVTSTRDGGTVAVEVRDDGPPLTDEELARAFGEFERLEDEPYPGTGLALATCRKIVERAGGTISVRNDEAGGVVVRFTLPAAP